MHRVGDKGLPTEPLGEGGDGVSLASNAGDVGANGLEHPLLTARSAPASAHILGFSFDLFFPCNTEQPVHSMVLQNGVNGLSEGRFVGDLPLAPTSGRRQGSQFFLRMAQTCFQPRGLLLGMHGRSQHQHPFRPCLCAPRHPPGPFHLIAFGREHLVTSVIGAEDPCQCPGLAVRHPRSNPGLHGLRRRPGSRQRGQVQMLVPHNIRPGVQGAHLAIADKQQTALLQPPPDTINDGNV